MCSPQPPGPGHSSKAEAGFLHKGSLSALVVPQGHSPPFLGNESLLRDQPAQSTSRQMGPTLLLHSSQPFPPLFRVWILRPDSWWGVALGAGTFWVW